MVYPNFFVFEPSASEIFSSDQGSLSLPGVWIFCPGKAVERMGGGVAKLRRQGGKAALPYRIISK
jgi:hypothetical protein